MIKKSYNAINLTCSFQSSNPFGEETPSTLNSTPSTFISGLFSKNPDGTFTFEEVVPKVRDVRNAKLFDGRHISMVRMKNGRLQIHFKVIDTIEDPKALAFAVYSELLTALNIID